jgi:hypothetical protein
VKEDLDPESYEPKPIDTSCVQLPSELHQRIEELAQNNHEVWSQERLQNGWKYGPERNDEKKEHPGLVRYQELSESEKDVDRKTVEQTLKAAVALGCKVEPTDPPAACEPGGVYSTDDMEDWPSLPPGFGPPKEDLLNIYRAADVEAKKRQRDHRWAVIAAAVAGTFAVITAIFELYLNRETMGGALAESGLAFLALVAVVVAIFAAWMPKWLLERHRAERCRFAKYRVLVRLAAAGREVDALGICLSDFKEQVRKIERLDEDDLEQFMQEDPVPDDPPRVNNDFQVEAKLRELSNHYVKQRLTNQAKYFFTQSRKKSSVDAWVKLLPPVFFFGSILLAFIHFAISGYRHYTNPPLDPSAPKDDAFHFWSLNLLIVGAAALPVIGSGVRLLRSAFEYSRNTARFRAKYRALEQLISKVEVALGRGNDFHPEDIVRYMWKGELLLENEHREWLRLMKEAEWFG